MPPNERSRPPTKRADPDDNTNQDERNSRRRRTYGTDPVDLVLDRLERCRRSGRGWTARCPAHEDRYPSLSVAEGRDGRVLLNCFAGCPTDEVVAALGLEWSDLFVDDRQRPPGPPRLKRDVGNFRIPRIAGRWGKRNAFFLEWELSRLLASVPKLQAQRDVLQSWDYLAERVDIPLVVGTADYLRATAIELAQRGDAPLDLAAAVRFVLRKSSA